MSDIGSTIGVSMTTYGVEKGWSVSGPSLSLHFGMEPKLVHRSTVAGIVNQPIVVSEGELEGGAIIYSQVVVCL